MIQNRLNNRDDSLFGLLSLYKSYNTYFRVLVSEEDGIMAVMVSDNPGKWRDAFSERYSKYRQLRRLEMGVARLSVKYITPEHLIKIMGSGLGIRVPAGSIEIVNPLSETGPYIFETKTRYKKKVLHGIGRIIKMSPQKKYEILEKSISETQV